jgi:ABC-type transporter Mla subunit MlaD
MNNAQRKAIDRIIGNLDLLSDSILSLAEEEREKFESLPDSLRDAEAGEKLDNAATALDGAVAALQEALEALVEAKAQ